MVTKLPSNATYRDNLLWRLAMHYGKMPRATLGSRVGSHGTTVLHCVLLLKSRTCGEHTSGQCRSRTGPLPDMASSGQKTPLVRILRNFRLCLGLTYFRTHPLPVTSRDRRHFRWKGPTRADIAQLHAHNILPVTCNGLIPHMLLCPSLYTTYVVNFSFLWGWFFCKPTFVIIGGLSEARNFFGIKISCKNRIFFYL